MNIVLLGAGGQLGRELQKNTTHQLIALTHQALDISQLTVESAVALLQQYSAQVVINAAAYTAVDKAEHEAEMAYAVNAKAVGILAQACEEAQVRLIHISTDYVFNGRASTPYQAHKDTGPLNVYGETKALGEFLLFQHCANAVCLRTSGLYAESGNNFVNTMLRVLADDKPVSVVNDQISSPTYAADLAAVVWQIIEKPEINGFYHFSNAGQCSWFELARYIQQLALAKGLLQQTCEILPVSSEEYGALALRPAYSVLNSDETARILNIKPRDWQMALDEMLQKQCKE
jgi:dTDP-4-dehydrorhamnose reductase